MYLHALKDSRTVNILPVDGPTNKEIAVRFGITEGTVKSHVFRLAIVRASEIHLLK
ncbi:sigma factor-like helix-turn-helix DNA-binding protein [Paenibacillus jiagnxiensis]|uniref:sigma factor-like helix-turn-helix DNA-binding protein n=1 Tax=Paenibacillus jiagnxiensis TaxID=3228926 RepID=UPI0033A25A5F